MDDFVVRENIKRFEAQLQYVADRGQRAVIERLLKAERQRLRELAELKSPAAPAQVDGVLQPLFMHLSSADQSTPPVCDKT